MSPMAGLLILIATTCVFTLAGFAFGINAITPPADATLRWQIWTYLFAGGFSLLACGTGVGAFKLWREISSCEWELQVLDDLGDWGCVNWSKINSQCANTVGIIMHDRSAEELRWQKLEALTTRVKVLVQKKIMKNLYGERPLRLWNDKTEEAIPVEALGI